MNTQKLYPAVLCVAIVVLGLLGSGLPGLPFAAPAAPAWASLVILGTSLVIAAGVGVLLHRTMGRNCALAEKVAEKTRELESQFAELQFDRAAVEDAAAENVSLAEDLYIAREQAENNAKFLNVVMDNISQGIAVFSRDGILIKWNGQLSDILSVPETRLAEGMSADAFNALMAEISQFAVEPGPKVSEAVEREWTLANGRTLSVRHTDMPGGGFIKTFTDITERKKAEDIIWEMAHHDALTGLANRARFNQEIEEAVKERRRHDDRFALAMIDLDRFKPVNDRFGHVIGDKLLVAIAKILKRHVRDSDLVARLGGDEFAILFRKIEAADVAVKVAERIITAIASPLTLDGHQITVGASAGVALYPDHAPTVPALISAADRALYSVKAAGRGAVAMSGVRSLDSRRAESRTAG